MTVWLAEPFPTIELFLVVGLKKEIPLTLNPCFCLCKGLSGLLWDQDNGWRPGIESLVAHPQQEPLLSPRLQTCFQTATCYFPLYSCPFDSNWGGREGRAVKQGLPMIIARYMKLFISWSLSYNTLMGHTGFLDWSPLGVRIRPKWTPSGRKKTTVSVRGGSFQTVGLNSQGFALSHLRVFEPGSCLKVIADKLFEVLIDTLTNCCLFAHMV